jgi:hypothetical protein
VTSLRVVRIAQIAVSDWRSLQARARAVLIATEANMDRFVRSQNVEHYRRLLEGVTDESNRQQIINLLAEERQKQKDAGDLVW